MLAGPKVRQGRLAANNPRTCLSSLRRQLSMYLSIVQGSPGHCRPISDSFFRRDILSTQTHTYRLDP